MISRVWRGWTVTENAGAYQDLLLDTIIPGIRARNTPGFLGIRVGRRDAPGTTDEVEFMTTMLFESLEAVIAFAGEEYHMALVPTAARQLLLRFDAQSAHYDVVGGDGIAHA